MDIFMKQSISLSCKTLVLKQSSVFVSAFPGKIVFGDVIEQNYPEFKYFQFFHFEIFNLYLALVAIIKNIVNNSQEESENKGIIIKFNDELCYLWCINNNQINLILEYKSKNVYQLTFTLDQFNDFIYTLSESFLPCLCLKGIEKQFLEFVAQQEIYILIQIEKNMSNNLLKEFALQNNFQIDPILQPNLIDLAVYYNEFLIF